MPMRRAYPTLLRRSIRKTSARFLSILLIVAIGCGFLAGLLATTPDMQDTADAYYDAHRLFDLDVRSTLGMTDADAEAIAALDSVEQVMGVYSRDIEMEFEGQSRVIRVTGVPFDKRGTDEFLNDFILLSGRLPENENECVLVPVSGYSDSDHAEGEVYTISGDNRDLEDIQDVCLFDSLTVVGIGRSPMYMSVESEPTTVGTGRVALVMYVPITAFDADYYTDLYLTVTGAGELSAFSDAYTQAVDAAADELQAMDPERSALRYDEIVSEAQEAIADAEEELREKTAEAEEKLADAKQELESGEQELADAKRELADAEETLEEKKTELEDGERELADAKEELEEKLSDARNDAEEELRQKIADARAEGEKKIEDARTQALAEIEDGRAQLEDARAELAAQEPELLDAEKQLSELDEAAAKVTDADRVKLSAARREYNESEEQLETAQAELDAKSGEIRAAQEQVAAAQEEIDGQRAALDAAKAQLDAAEAMGYPVSEEQRAAVTAGYAALAAAQEELDEQSAPLKEAQSQISDAYEEIRLARETLWEKGAELEEAENQLYRLDRALEAVTPADREKVRQARADYNAAANTIAEKQAELEKAESELPELIREQYDTLEQKLADARAEGLETIERELADARAEAEEEIAEAEEELEDGRTKLADAGTELADAKTRIADAEKELADGQHKYDDARTEADEKIADARAKLDDAKAEVEDIEVPEWYITDRSDTVSFSSFSSNSEKIGAIARVFPIFFFFVAALVALTTMTRMVEEERGQIGTLKSLGYSDRRIMSYYVWYSIAASLTGALLGMLTGFLTLPRVISNAYGMMYTLPAVKSVIRAEYALLIAPIAVICTTAATFAACLGQLSERPASLMRPRAPREGRRILLERIPFLWRRMSFTQKVTARNILRYRKRFWMTVIGISGCTALLVTGFGLRDSIHDIVDVQFGEINRYNLSVYLSEDCSGLEDEALEAYLGDGTAVNAYTAVHSESATLEHGKDSGSVTLYVPQETQRLSEFITLRERRSHESIPFGEDSVVVTEKLCETLGVGVGDTVTLRDADGRSAEVTVTGITECYVSAYCYISADTYTRAFGHAPEYKLLLVDVPDDTAEARDAASARILESDNVLLVQFSQTIRESFSNTVRSIDYIVIVLILAAGGLAVVVLYNLTNINICERVRELATLKVLGFREGETAAYIYRETGILSLIGTLAGMGFGTWLHAFVVKSAEVDAVMFGRVIAPQSYLFAALVTLAFTALVDVFMLGKLKSISMVESMKAIE